MFLYILGVAISGWGFVMIMLNGGVRECVFLLTGVAAIITKVFEKQLGSRAKYVYACIPPVLGAVTAAVGGSSESAGYVCLTHYYFVATLLLVLYYEQKILKVSTAVTIVVNAAMMIVFPAGFLKLHLPIGWIFTGIVYVILFVACCFIVHRTTSLFGVVEDKEKGVESVLDSVQMLSGKLYEAGTALSQISENESEAGKGFAVVATEVGTLAHSTQESLKVVQSVIERVQNNVTEITAQVEENSSKLGTQNAYFDNVFKSMRDMTKLLNESVSAVQTMGDTYAKQAEVIERTVTINQDIAESIRKENEQFHSINSMAEGNAGDTAEVTKQAGVINEMVDEMSRILNREA